MRCIVTGAAGFIGSHLVDALLAEGHSVLGIDDLSTGRTKNLAKAQGNPGFAFLEKNIRSVSRNDLVLPECDWFFHLAGRADLVPSIVNPEDYFQVNVEGTFRALQLARELGVKRFLYAASSTCYGIPDIYPTPESMPCKTEHPYALTKLMGEEMVMHWHRVYQLPAVSLRLFNVYGPRSRTTGAYGAVFGVFLRQKLAGVPFTVVGDGSQTRDFTFVSDVASAFVATAKSNISGEIMNVGSGHTYAVNRLVELLGGEKTTIPRRPGEPDCTFADTTKIRARVGWQPSIPLEQGVSRMLEVIDDWRDAPLWNQSTIAEATADWFKHLGHTS
ncbi:MAG: NAD-dependent epimerase/dehydratase family protein [Terrimicrobiaceae bacterium]